METQTIGEFLADPNKNKNKSKPYPIKLRKVEPRTINQNKIFKAFDQGKHLFIHGTAGTGKSFIAVYLGLQAVLNNHFDELIIVRSTVPTRSQGFLPGNDEEKNEIFEAPYEALFTELTEGGVSNPYKNLKFAGKVRFMSTSYLRGLTLNNCAVVVDEVQNMNFGEINTVMTRMGENCHVFVCGDELQDDLQYLHEKSAFSELKSIIHKMPSFSTIKMNEEDICRGGIVKEWLLACNDNIQNNQHSER